MKEMMKGKQQKKHHGSKNGHEINGKTSRDEQINGSSNRNRLPSPVILAVKLPGTGKKHGSGRHVESHSEGLSGKQGFDESFAEENLDRLFENGQKSRVVDADAAF